MTVQSPRIAFWTIVLAGAALIWGALALFAHLVHAEPAVAGAWQQAQDAGTNVTAWIAGLAAVLSAVSIALHIIAPRTRATWDDKLRDDVDEALSWIRGRPPGPPTDTVPAKPDGVTSGTIGILAVLLLGAGLTLQPGCAARQRGAAGAEAYLDCEAPALHDAIADTASWAKDRIVSLILGSGKPDYSRLREAMGYLKSDVGKCAYAAAIAALTYQPPAGVTEQALSGGPVVDKAALRAAFVAARADLGWGEVRTNGVTL